MTRVALERESHHPAGAPVLRAAGYLQHFPEDGFWVGVFPRLIKASENSKDCVPHEIRKIFLWLKQSDFDHYRILSHSRGAWGVGTELGGGRTPQIGGSDLAL